MALTVLVGKDLEVARFVIERVDGLNSLEDLGNFKGWGFCQNGKLLAGMLFNCFNGHDINMHLASDSPRWCTKNALKLIAHQVYNRWGCERMTALVGRKNKRCRKFVEGIGFKLEGVKRKGAGPASDLCIYGMLKNECKWLRV